MKLCECGCGAETTVHRGVARRYITGHNSLLKKRWEARDCGYETPCHVFLGHCDRAGYGTTDRRRNGEVKAHRDAWVETNGPIPAGLDIHHKCRNKSCVNADHLMVVTRKEHGRFDPRSLATHCKRNHEFTPGNTIWRYGDSGRRCRACHYESVRRWEIKVGKRRVA